MMPDVVDPEEYILMHVYKELDALLGGVVILANSLPAESLREVGTDIASCLEKIEVRLDAIRADRAASAGEG